MKKVLAAIVLVLFYSSAFSYTFINSVPAGAEVFLNKESIGTTPLVLKDTPQKKVTFRFSKAGYYDTTLNFKSESKLTNLYSIMTPDTFSLYFPEKNTVVINKQSYDNEEIRNIPSGYYHFKTESDAIYMNRVNPNQKYLIFSLVATGIGLTTGLVAYLVGNTAFEAYQNNTNVNNVFSLLETAKTMDSIAVTGFGLAGLGGAFSIYFGIDAINYKQKNKSIQISSQDKTVDYQVYNLAMDQISQGKNEEALKNFTKVIEKYKDSKFVPVSLLRRAILFQKEGKLEESNADLLLIRDSYPIYEIYEIAVKYLAENYTSLQQYDLALESYQDIRNIHENYSLDEIDLDILATRIIQAKASGADVSGIKSDISDFITRNGLELDLKARAETLMEELQ